MDRRKRNHPHPAFCRRSGMEHTGSHEINLDSEDSMETGIELIVPGIRNCIISNSMRAKTAYRTGLTEPDSA
jgi:hypothetical protein